ncbi:MULTISPECIES: DUF4383 domain-containing protein [unclassified Crossiella]|uniref:DUF4383 domain-containing protein n=1 Tax=unclassified Crossiella TaxID=2620835 RepID=UPI001FFE98A0|nr:MULTISPECIES: DUF4383 domain-containing protein [unclassified Crossiella]MCK2243433.1 DUF4383 domain-containing protein [Crossiella sp. S99.2]MCK2257291.1 DUF4383 domain-containing protein [Crossiella sp. S99.1]
MSAATTVPRTPVQTAAQLTGLLFLIVGIAGFIPGLTTNIEALAFAGRHSGALLLGVFAVSVLHNLVHLAFGLAALVLARSTRGAALYLIGGGLLLLMLWFYGLVVSDHSPANFLPLNEADDWLHLLLALGLGTLGFGFGGRAVRELG